MYFCGQCSQFFWERDMRFCPMCGRSLRGGISVDVKLTDVADPASFARWVFDHLREIWPDSWTREMVGDNPRVGTLYIFDQTILLALRPRMDMKKLQKEIDRRKAEGMAEWKRGQMHVIKEGEGAPDGLDDGLENALDAEEEK